MPEIAARMTKDSGVFGIPMPDDSTPVSNSQYPTDLVGCEIGTIQEVTAFYKDYMSSDGWIFDQQCSALEPYEAEDKKVGYLTQCFYAKPTDPVTTVGIIVGNADGKPGHKRRLVLSVSELRDEDLPRGATTIS
jgi:hypothetical protein